MLVQHSSAFEQGRLVSATAYIRNPNIHIYDPLTKDESCRINSRQMDSHLRRRCC